jgi:hypothetical protein
MGTKHSPDTYGWMFIVGLSWLAGFLDCRLFAKSDQDRQRVLPPDANEPSDDQSIFKS